ncbi:MAG: gamma-glutamyltransferase family protein [Pseudohongiellaceae bacterium]
MLRFNLRIVNCNSLKPILITITFVIGFSFSSAQENAYPLQMSSSGQTLRPEVPGPNGLVTAGHPLAAMSGLQILMAGGNAIDASVATLATLNVVRPQMSGAGGNGFFTYYHRASGTVHSLNATGAAPLALDASSLSSADLDKGIKAGVVPGLLGGWIAMLQRFGSLSLEQVLAPAIAYAEQGHPIESSVVRSIDSSKEVFEKFGTSTAVFLPDNKVPGVGQLFKMEALAATFRKLVQAEEAALNRGGSREEGLQAAFDRFYKGDIADEMARFYEQSGGLFKKEDFSQYEPQWSEPLYINYRGFDIYSSPPSSRGGLEVLMQLKLVEGFDLSVMDKNDARLTHILAEAIQIAKSDIYHFVADPSRVSMPITGLLSNDYAADRRQLIDLDKHTPFPEPGEPNGSRNSSATHSHTPAQSTLALKEERSSPGSTTSFSIRDSDGNVMAATPTHGGAFGTGVVVGNTGLTFNNGTRIGSTSPYPEDVNYARGGQVPILNNSPVIVMKEGEFVAALGTPGGETIGQTQFQVLVNLLDFGMPIQAAIEAPRFSLFAQPNFYKPGAEISMRIENRVPEHLFEDLRGLGHQIQLAPAFSLGSIQGILVHQQMQTITAGADPRRAAYAVGW